MTTGHVYIACSLDGFIARTDGSLDWLERTAIPDAMERYEAFLADKDGIVMGRGTFDFVVALPDWPFAKPVVVLSRTLTPGDLPARLSGKVRLTSATPADIMTDLAAEGWSRAYVDGGVMVQSFLAAGLVADLVVTRLPILLGRGIPLFGGLPETDLDHLGTEVIGDGAVQSRYRVRTRHPV